jgi:hypothetical protein
MQRQLSGTVVSLWLFVTKSMSAADIYAHCLLPLKEGYPLYRPELHERLDDPAYSTYRSQGISIGDVGIIRQGGDFDFLFNICKDPVSGRGSTVNISDSTVKCATRLGLSVFELN